MEQKQLLVMRQYGIGLAEGEEASGYAKFEWGMRDCRVMFAAKGLTRREGQYIGAVLQGTQLFVCGEMALSPSGAVGRFRIAMGSHHGGVLAAAVFYREEDTLYPVLLGHKGGGSAWQEELITGVCRKLSLHRGETPAQKSAPKAEQKVRAQEQVPRQAEAAPVQEKETEARAERTPMRETAPETAGQERVEGTYYEQNREHFLHLLSQNEAVEELNALIPGSSWVRVQDASRPDGQYVFGIVYDERKEPLFLCYGVSGQAEQSPPQDLSAYCQWVPKSFDEPQEGYWVVYQSAEDGKTYQGE